MSRIEELEKRLAADPNSRMFVQLAEEYRKAGLLEQAIDCCEKGLKKHPQYPSARVALGRALLEAGTFDRACAEFETVLKQVPDNILANKFLGETYHRLGRLDDALKKYRVAQTLAPEDTELDDRIRDVQAELSGGGQRPAAPAPVGAPPPPSIPGGPEPRTAPMPAARPAPPEPSRVVDLPPIPLVEVNEPMVLEGRDYAPPPKKEEAKPGERPAPPREPAFHSLEDDSPFEATILDPGPMVQQPIPSPAPPSAPPAAKSPVTDIETPTMAEIYANQGHFEQALAVYRRIIERQPNEPKYRERVEELLMLARARAGTSAGSDADERTIRALEQWLEAIRKSRGA